MKSNRKSLLCCVVGLSLQIAAAIAISIILTTAGVHTGPVILSILIIAVCAAGSLGSFIISIDNDE